LKLLLNHFENIELLKLINENILLFREFIEKVEKTLKIEG